jgi:hypothetical protein
VWTAPVAQGETKENPDAVLLRSCVRSPLSRGQAPFVRPAPLARMGSAIPSQTDERPVPAATLPGFCGSSDRPISIFSFSPSLAADARSGGGRRWPVGLAARHHGPHDAGRPRPAPGQALLAKATAASWRGMRPSRSSSHGEAPGRAAGGSLVAGAHRLACWMTAVAPSTSSWRSRSSPG